MLCSPQTTFWRSLDPDVVDQGFVFAFLRAPLLQDQIRSLMHESDMAPYVSLTNQRGLLMTLPPIAEQRAIAALLGALDNKIESNARTSAAAVSVLRFAVPIHGTVMPLAKTASFVNGGALTKVANGAGRPILRIKELRGGVTAETPRTDAAVRQNQTVSFGELLFSWSGTLLVTRWAGEDAVLNQHVFRVSPDEAYPTWLVEAWIEQHLPAFRRIAADKATTMGHIQRHHLTDAEVLVPPGAELKELRARWDPVDELRMGLLAESRTLTAIRDALLPKLVSGQIRVPLSNDSAESLGAAVEALNGAAP